MSTEPGSLDGLRATIVSGDRPVAEAVLEDRRYVLNRRVHDQVFVRFQTYVPDFAKQLPRPFSGEERMLRSIPVDVALEDGREFRDAQVGHPWIDQLGTPVEEIPFQLDHPDL